MNNEQNSKARRHKRGGMTSIKLAFESDELKSTPGWKSADRLSASLIKDGPLSIMLMVLKQGARLHEHRAKGPIALQVLSGSIRFIADTEHVVSEGEMIGLAPNIAHSVEALEESSVILVAASID